ncbi:hypothetical protein OAK04_03800 [Verrucomicrobia bacterium]|nr:hypothetical protein [Verrucomicrobiota bacterium]
MRDIWNLQIDERLGRRAKSPELSRDNNENLGSVILAEKVMLSTNKVVVD